MLIHPYIHSLGMYANANPIGNAGIGSHAGRFLQESARVRPDEPAGFPTGATENHHRHFLQEQRLGHL